MSKIYRWLLLSIALGLNTSLFFGPARAEEIVPRVYLPLVAKTCLSNVADPLLSQLQVQNSPVWADNESFVTVSVALLDNCGVGILDERAVTLNSSRPMNDVITPLVNSAPISNTYTFLVRSNTVGTSTFTATVGSLLGGTGPTVTITGAQNQGAFTCVIGTQSMPFNPKQLVVSYTNPAPPSVNRRIVQLQVNWQTVSGSVISNTLNQASLGPSSNVIWLGPANTPVNIGIADWTSVFRTIASSDSADLTLDFANQVSPPVGSQWRYTITATWDNGFNSSYCSSPPVVINLP